MCGVACFFGKDKIKGIEFGKNACSILKHRGPDDDGIYIDHLITLVHTRLSILELSQFGHQPMHSSCGRYIIAFNGEIYNHLDLRKKYLSHHSFKGHSDTETILELFCMMQEKMLYELVGMWAIFLWDKKENKLFVSRDRFGQKPIYMRWKDSAWLLASEVKPLLDNEKNAPDITAVAEYLALGNYGHLNTHTFYNDIKHFPEGTYAWLHLEQQNIDYVKYWELPDIREKDKVPFDKRTEKELHDTIVEAVLSQTLSDVPIGATVSGGIDSSIIAGILATYYDDKIHLFTAQSPNTKYDETKYVNAIIDKFGKDKFIVYNKDLTALSIKKDLEKYISIQEEPFGDPSIIAHGFLIEMAREAGIKVILNGQGADEIFFGYNNMSQAILLKQLRGLHFNKFYDNIKFMKMGKMYMLRTLLKCFLPEVEHTLRIRSRKKKRQLIRDEILAEVDEKLINTYKSNDLHEVWRESIYGMHLPHLVHYDDRNGMASGIEGRMPFLDHRIAEVVGKIQPEEFLNSGRRKYLLRYTCREYLPELVYNRTDKIGFYTPLIHALKQDKKWINDIISHADIIKADYLEKLLSMLNFDKISLEEALYIWRILSLYIWSKQFNLDI